MKMSNEKSNRHYAARTEGGIKLLLTPSEFKRAKTRGIAEEIGINIQSKSIKRPILKVLYYFNRPLSFDELVKGIQSSESVTQEESELFRSNEQIRKALHELTHQSIIETRRLEPDNPYSKSEYIILNRGKQWVESDNV
jgi:predicted metal-dependent TIM-barrel fold hydrolase